MSKRLFLLPIVLLFLTLCAVGSGAVIPRTPPKITDLGNSTGIGLNDGSTYSNFGSASDDTINELYAALDAAIGGLGGGHDAVTLGADADILLGLNTQQLILDAQLANVVFAGPPSGGSADPTFRLLVPADIPDLSAIYEPAGITASDISDLSPNSDITADLEEETHASEHIDGAADPIDGDKLEISATWANITPDIGIAQADSVDDLAAILKGIDDALAETALEGRLDLPDLQGTLALSQLATTGSWTPTATIDLSGATVVFGLDDGDVPDAHSHATDAIDAITEIAAALKSGADGTLVTGTKGTNGNLAEWNADGDLVDASVATADLKPAAIEVVLGGGDSAIATGVKMDVIVPFNCTITNCYLLADQAGSITVDVWKDTYANFPPDNSDSITDAGTNPSISSGIKMEDTTLTNWTTSLTKGDILRINVDSCTAITRCTLSLGVER